MNGTKEIIENIDKVEQSHVYKSGLHDGVEEFGKAITTVGKAVNACLLPVTALVWGADKIENWLTKDVSAKLENLPPEKIVAPNPHIVGPAIEALKFTAQEEELRDMFSELIASSLNSDKNTEVHPSFVDIIKSMDKIDALIIKELSKTSSSPLIDIIKKKNGSQHFEYLSKNVTLLGVNAQLDNPWSSIASLNNLERMGLCKITTAQYLTDESVYEKIKAHPGIKKVFDDNSIEGEVIVDIKKGTVEMTRFGKMFINTCTT